MDPLSPQELRPAFQDIFRQVQRGKVLESYRYLPEGYLLALDGTQYFHSDCIHCSSCLEKHHEHEDGTTTVSYHHQMVGAVILHPDKSEVIPLTPEPIIKQDGALKNDCERNATRRLLAQLREDHPFLPVVVVEDALSSNAPHVRDLKEYGMHFLLGVKEGDHAFLFEEVRRREEEGDTRGTWVRKTVRTTKTKKKYLFAIMREVPLNESNQDVQVTVVRCWEENEDDGATQMFSWITDLTVTEPEVYAVMRAGRARWKVENETFNTLKNQGYHYEHNFGHGQQNLSVVFALLMMLAFLIDQVLQLCDPLFQGAWRRLGSKRALWERQRSLVYDYRLQSLRELYEALCYGYAKPRPRIQYQSDSS